VARARWALQAWDFIACRLAGGRLGAASTFAGDEVWRADWLEAADLAGSPLIPSAVDAGRAYAETGGPWSEEAGLPHGIPVVGGLNDGIGSIVGAAGSVVGRATDPGGAAGGLAVCWPERLTAPGRGLLGRARPGDVHHRRRLRRRRASHGLVG
jgi:sugar (pentulose or hexulose) kinase